MKKLLFISFLVVSATLLGNVKLVNAWRSGASRGSSRCATYSYNVKVKNLGTNKTVSIHHEDGAGNPWIDIDTSFVKSIDNGWELWRVSKGNCAGFINGTQFVVKYDVDGATYWDNNNGQDYFLDIEGPLFGEGVNVKLTSSASYYSESTDKTHLSVTATVRNIAYHKNIIVRYTTDDWATFQDITASFNYGYHMGFGNTISAPTRHNLEPWQAVVELDGDVSDIEFAIAYTADGATYWDNNYGSNYVISR